MLFADLADLRRVPIARRQQPLKENNGGVSCSGMIGIPRNKSPMFRPHRTPARASALLILAASSLGGGLAFAQTEGKALMSDQFFKNIQVLKGIPVNEFMATMGFFSASLGYSCENCHDGNTWENYISDAPAKKRRARGMVTMVAAINKNFFGGRQVVTCYSCHHGVNQPRITPDLTALYSS